MYIGLTGNIASGKSTVAKMFAELGCYTIDADEVSRKVMSKGESAYNGVVEYFGDNILDNNGNIDRVKLKGIVFNEPEKKEALEKIVHPAILEYEKKLVSNIKGKDDKAIILTQAALIIEKNTYDRFDAVMVVYVDEETQLQRLLKRDGIDKDLAMKIIKSQMPIEEKIKYADFIVDNSRDLEFTKSEVDRVFEAIKIYKYCQRQLKKK
ncbi:dephospho-CoA kinase [Deferribacterales bacterium Es71-Z0220]|uniref:dephospho-CoA kinase n=1 Tax=Deferrivibrio essentukiensis TaxID=2880922 RepID=UPI001F616FEB|nr:dephospho-CoA kinase [Deferrivibrio essentukiensis]